MDAAALEATQAPLKASFSANPEAAPVTLRAEGDLDFRGTLGVDKQAPVGFRDVRVLFDLDTAAAPEKLETLIRPTECYCVVLHTLRSAPTTSVVVSTGQAA